MKVCSLLNGVGDPLRRISATNGELASDTTMLTNGVGEPGELPGRLSTIALPAYTASDRPHAIGCYSHVNSAAAPVPLLTRRGYQQAARRESKAS